MKVPGTFNAADCASRGISTAQLQGHNLWWSGPPWIESPSSWPAQPTLDYEQTISEAQHNVSLYATTTSSDCHWELISKHSTFNKLLRVIALCTRFLARLRKESDVTPVIDLMPESFEKTRIFWILATQRAYFSQKFKSLKCYSNLPSASTFSTLTAFVDTQVIIKGGGRLDRSDLAYENKHPAILPRNTYLSVLFLVHIRQKYWIIGGRAPVKTHILLCVMCAHRREIRAHQLMGPLPLCWVTHSRSFTNIGVDYTGSLTIKTWRGRSAKIHKAWICVFVRLSTSTVHLEMVSDYSTDGFITAYRRFSALREITTMLYSDYRITSSAQTQLSRNFSIRQLNNIRTLLNC